MATYKIIQELTLERSEKELFTSLAHFYDKHMPGSLYLDPYELAYGENIPRHDPRYEHRFHGIPNTTPDQWDQFLDIPEVYRYRHARIAKLTEYSAIKAMKGLEAQGQSAGPGAVSALKEIASLSKQLNAGNNNKQKIILTYVRPKKREEQTS